MNLFDKVIIDFITRNISHSHSFYEIILYISENNLLKGGVLILIIWHLWFKNTDLLPARRINIIATLSSVFVAIIISKVITALAPFRNRPILSHEVTFFSFETDTSDIDRLSSFPSDHAALFISLAMGIFFVSKRAGIFALLYTCLVILAPRVYLGYHYPTDIIAGGVIGVVVGVIFNKWKFILNRVSKTVITFSEKFPHWFYSLFFLISFEIAVMFKDVREFGGFLRYFFS